MADTLGLLGGLSHGVAEGLKTYIGIKQMMNEQALKQRLYNAQNINAYSNLAAKSGSDIADQYTDYLGITKNPGAQGDSPSGLLPQKPQTQGLMPSAEGAGPVGNFSPPPQTPQQTRQWELNPGQGMPSQEEQAYMRKKAFAMPEVGRENFLAPMTARVKDFSNLGTPSGAQGYKAGQTSLWNSGLTQFNTAKGDFDRADANNVQAALAFQKAKDAKNTPQGVKSLQLNVYQLENPGSKATSFAEALKENPDWFQSWKDRVKLTATGSLTDKSFQDIQNQLNDTYAPYQKMHDALVQQSSQRGKVTGAGNKFTQSPFMDQTNKLYKQQEELRQPYQSGIEQTAGQATGLLKKGPNPSEQMRLKKFLQNANPNDPKAIKARQILGM